MSWLITAAQKIDPDAAVYLSRVEAADGQTLEPAVRTAVEQFIVGCKADGIWNAIKASCILAGARTLNGALVPLAGVPPTNVGGNFVSGDYNRKTGLLGNGGNKQLDSNRSVTADPIKNNHISVFASTNDTFASGLANNFYMGAVGSNNRALGRTVASNTHTVINDSGSTAGLFGPTPPSNGFFGLSSQSSTTTVRTASASTGITSDTAVSTGNIFVFSRNTDRPVNARLAFYSIGEALDIAKLDTRVTTLINALAAAIP